jgi:hypothetical protein
MRSRLLTAALVVLLAGTAAGCGWSQYGSAPRAPFPGLPKVDGRKKSTARLVHYLEQHGYSSITCTPMVKRREVECQLLDSNGNQASIGFGFAGWQTWACQSPPETTSSTSELDCKATVFASTT